MQSKFGLGASIWAQDLDRAEKITRSIECGIGTVNNVVISDPRVPFGGISCRFSLSNELITNFKNNRFKGLTYTYKLRNERIMSEKQQPPYDIDVLRWDAESFTVEGMNLGLENLRGQRIPRLILRHNGKIIDNLTDVVITRVYKHQDNRHRYEETEFRYTKDVMHDP